MASALISPRYALTCGMAYFHYRTILGTGKFSPVFTLDVLPHLASSVVSQFMFTALNETFTSRENDLLGHPDHSFSCIPPEKGMKDL